MQITYCSPSIYLTELKQILKNRAIFSEIIWKREFVNNILQTKYGKTKAKMIKNKK